VSLTRQLAFPTISIYHIGLDYAGSQQNHEGHRTFMLSRLPQALPGALAILIVLGCTSPAGKDQLPLSPYEPTAPYNFNKDSGVFERDAPLDAGARTRVRDLIVPPGPSFVPLAFEAHAGVEIRTGSGVLRHGEKEMVLDAGAYLEIPAGTKVQVRADGRPATLHVTLVLDDAGQ
jgi:hypothetical protein